MTELMWHSPLTTSLLLGLLGCCVGSFINVVVYRLPIMREHPEESSGYNLAWPPSSCPRCGSAIKTQHNLPIISYLWLGGRSACCQGHISRRYIAMEITAGLLAAGISYWLLNYDLDMSRVFALLLPTLLLVWWLVAIAGMLCYSSEDTKTLWQSLLWLGLLTTILRDSLGLNKSILGVCLIYSLALLWNQAKDFMRPNDATIPKRISHHSLQPVWHSLAAMAAWFVLPKAEALAIGLAAAAAWGLWTALNQQTADFPAQWTARAVELAIVITFGIAWVLTLADLLVGSASHDLLFLN